MELTKSEAQKIVGALYAQVVACDLAYHTGNHTEPKRKKLAKSAKYLRELIAKIIRHYPSEEES